MTTIRDSIESAVGYLTEHPDEARYTDSVAVATLGEALHVEVEGTSGERATTDMPASIGGLGAAPSPAWFLRAGLASCVAALIALRAAQREVELTVLRVTVDSESDDRGILGVDPSVPAGPISVRIDVHVEAPGAAETAVRELVDWGVEHCPVADAVRRAVDVSVTRS